VPSFSLPQFLLGAERLIPGRAFDCLAACLEKGQDSFRNVHQFDVPRLMSRQPLVRLACFRMHGRWDHRLGWACSQFHPVLLSALQLVRCLEQHMMLAAACPVGGGRGDLAAQQTIELLDVSAVELEVSDPGRAKNQTHVHVAATGPDIPSVLRRKRHGALPAGIL